MNWIAANKEWIFSGVGVLVIATIVEWFRRSGKHKVRMTQKSGSGSTNYQAGGDIRVDRK